MALTEQQKSQVQAARQKVVAPSASPDRKAQIAAVRQKVAAGQPQESGGFLSSLASTAKTIGSAAKSVGGFLASNTINAGKDLGGAVVGNLPSVKKANESTAISASNEQRAHAALVAKRNQMKLQGKETSQLDSVIGDRVAAPQVSDILPEAAAKTRTQVAGDFAGLALDTLAGASIAGKTGQLGKVAPKAVKAAEGAGTAQKLLGIGANTAKTAVKGGATGYGYDVSANLQEGDTGTDVVKPGLGTVLGSAIPITGGLAAASKELLKGRAPRVINSLIKPLAKDFSYGKNPGRAVASEGIVARDFEDLATKIADTRSKRGQEIGAIQAKLDQLAQASASGKRLAPGSRLTSQGGLNLTGAISPIDEAMNVAASQNNPTLLKRLQDVKDALLHKLSQGADEVGNAVIQKDFAYPIDNMSLQGAFNMKTRVGDVTQFTGNPSDDKAVNAALKRVYGSIKGSILDAADELDPKEAAKLRKLSERYADLTSALVATKYREKIAERQNLISAPIKVGGAAGIITAIATGGAALPAILVAGGAAAIDKALQSPAAKTGFASWLAKETPSSLEKLYAKHPGLQEIVARGIAQIAGKAGMNNTQPD